MVKDTISRCDCTEDVHLLGHNNTNGTYQEYTKRYWLTAEQLFTPFYTNTMKYVRFLYILRFFHFSDNMNKPNKNNSNYDRLWKVRTL